MSSLQAQIPAPAYVGGKPFIERLMQITGKNSHGQLADVIGVPKSTISTWSERGNLSYEIVLRLHLALGVSVEWLSFGTGEPYESNRVLATESLTVSTLKNGELEETGNLSLDEKTLEVYGLLADSTLVIEQSDTRFFIDKNETNPTSGRYLIDVDGNFSINQIQRLPGKKLAVEFNGSTLTVDEGDIKVLGRVAMSMIRD
ncbi:phage repressor protein CI [Enterovibrio nigricans]|uniref:Bacteriophage CI repressor helix-turn-helix domain-containing protein n=1 Tax=Enterovibrio nigricans DSM 22720 TaxID=1121868 RepID=A0A1T4UFH0_9GAMM|nr:phage repressor protein CI [Enterovibrio nigricans]SKA51268.1 Bacteriophage CI repressor helix-turn-helix domain-containing protein [Enterovibrio nigricans DSM 22720]